LEAGIRRAIILLAGIVLFPALLHGQCTVSSVGVNFGSYNPLSSSSVVSNGTISILCNSSYYVSTSIGPSPNSGGFNPRQMKQVSGADLLSYYLYTTSAMTTIWGNGTQGTSIVTATARKNRTLDLIVYGRASSEQNVYVGQYTEALVATINF
jgi:spore coat protein U-like protein